MCDNKFKRPCIDCNKCIDYRGTRCLRCYKKYLADTKEKRGLKQKEYRKRWYQANKEKVRLQTKTRSAKLDKRTKRGYILKTKYGITIEEYETLLKKCNYKCMICTTDYSEEVPLVVDHCHASSKVRGLLCRSCNTGLGFFKDDIKLLKKAIKYLKNEKEL